MCSLLKGKLTPCWNSFEEREELCCKEDAGPVDGRCRGPGGPVEGWRGGKDSEDMREKELVKVTQGSGMSGNKWFETATLKLGKAEEVDMKR